MYCWVVVLQQLLLGPALLGLVRGYAGCLVTTAHCCWDLPSCCLPAVVCVYCCCTTAVLLYRR
jgi:hypothetical protein